MSDDILNAIDHAIEDYSVSKDAMRWTSEKPERTETAEDTMLDWIERYLGQELERWQRDVARWFDVPIETVSITMPDGVRAIRRVDRFSMTRDGSMNFRINFRIIE